MTDINKIGGSPLVEIQLGKGRLVASEMCVELGGDDPIARRLMMNVIEYLHKNGKGNPVEKSN